MHDNAQRRARTEREAADQAKAQRLQDAKVAQSQARARAKAQRLQDAEAAQSQARARALTRSKRLWRGRLPRLLGGRERGRSQPPQL
jgi:hypothetical protein